MCKHILIANFSVTDTTYIEQFTEKTYDRDGFGAIIRLKNNKLLGVKSLNQSAFYMRLGGLIANNNIKDIVIHHRTSTNKQGLDYAHPFEFKGTYLTHNGVVSVPGNHDTKTENDSEALLHHLIKSNFETKNIDGYFSCFLLDNTSSTILVDNTAPMFTDGRVYCSHKLNDSFTDLTLVKRVLDLNGNIVSDVPIQVIESIYGRDKAYLSLGNTYNNFFYKNNVDVFFEYLSYNDETLLYTMQTKKELHTAIKTIGASLCLDLTKKQVKEIAEVLHYDYLNLRRA